MNSHEYARDLAAKGLPLSAISKATGLAVSDLGYIKTRARAEYRPASQATPVVHTPVYEPIKQSKYAKLISDLCRRHKVSVEDIKSDQRFKKLVRPRQAIMFDLYTLCPELSTVRIGRMMNRDHTTVLHAVTVHAERRGFSFETAKAMRQKKADEMGISLAPRVLTKKERREFARLWRHG